MQALPCNKSLLAGLCSVIGDNGVLFHYARSALAQGRVSCVSVVGGCALGTCSRSPILNRAYSIMVRSEAWSVVAPSHARCHQCLGT